MVFPQISKLNHGLNCIKAVNFASNAFRSLWQLRRRINCSKREMSPLSTNYVSASASASTDVTPSSFSTVMCKSRWARRQLSSARGYVYWNNFYFMVTLVSTVIGKKYMPTSHIGRVEKNARQSFRHLFIHDLTKTFICINFTTSPYMYATAS